MNAFKKVVYWFEAKDLYSVEKSLQRYDINVEQCKKNVAHSSNGLSRWWFCLWLKSYLRDQKHLVKIVERKKKRIANMVIN